MRFLAVLIALLIIAPVQSQSSITPIPVTVPLVITDGNGFATSVSPEILELTEDGKVREIASITAPDPEEPLYIAVLMEYSRQLPTSPYGYKYGFYYPYQDTLYEEASVVFSLTERLREDDQVAFAVFGEKVTIIQEFKRDRTEIEDYLESIINSPVPPAEGYSHTFDAVNESLKNLSVKASGHKVILVLVGTGQDESFGKATYEEVLQNSRSLGIQVFFVRTGLQAVEDLLQYEQDYELQTGHKPNPLENVPIDTKYRFFAAQGRFIAEVSGGQNYELRFPTQSVNISEDIFLWAENTHKLVYLSDLELKPDGKLHKISIKITQPLKDNYGNKFKAKAITVDGRREPKRKKQ